MSWPEDVDGDVFRRLQARGFDFSSPHQIDFDVDFTSWPPPTEAVRWLKKEYGDVQIYEGDEDIDGYVQFKITAILIYDLVISTQRRVSQALAHYGGTCESWGVLHAAPQ